MNYEMKHLEFLFGRAVKGDILSNEDCEFLTNMRAELREANYQLDMIDEIMIKTTKYC